MATIRILTSTIAAAALLTAVPVLAEESSKTVEPSPVPACCERHEAQVRELTARLARVEKRAAEAAELATPPEIERHSVLDESW